jgi:hypothetical protein
MRIFYAVPPSPNAFALRSSRLWDINLYQPLVDMGHDVVRFEADYFGLFLDAEATDSAGRARHARRKAAFGRRLLEAVGKAHGDKPLDLFFSYFYSFFVDADVIRRIGELGTVTANWYCNASYQFDLVAEIAPAYHFCWVPEKFRLADYRRVGANPLYCQEAANASYYRPLAVERRHDIVFVGQKYGNRPAFVRAMIDAGLEPRVFGPGWQPMPPLPVVWRIPGVPRAAARLARLVWRSRFYGLPLSDADYVAMLSRAKISLGFTQVGDGTGAAAGIRQVRLRDFEAPMCGAFYLVERFDELGEFFEPDKEIVFFEGGDELVDKCRWYLAHETERDRIRLAGMRRAREEHSWHNRYRQMFDRMGLARR